MARPKQLPPENPRHPAEDDQGYRCSWQDRDGIVHNCEGQDDWFIWILLTGRGFGKTMVGSNWILEQALLYPESRWAVVAPTYDQVQNVCFDTMTSGIRAQALPGEITDYNKNNMLLTLSNGSEIKGFSAETPERIRGYNLAGAWLDEVGSFKTRDIWDEVLQPALRQGEPRVIVTTTPSASPLLKEWFDRWYKLKNLGEHCDIHITGGRMDENTSLPAKVVEDLKQRLEGTRIGRIELNGEMLGDFEGALWKREFIDAHRVSELDFFLPDGNLDFDKFQRVVVGFDPSMTSGEKADEHGIVVAGQGNDGHGYIIADFSSRGTPDEAARRAVTAYYTFNADCIVTEKNQAGDWLANGIRTVDPAVPVKLVSAQKGKFIRGQPISMLAEQGRLHHIGHFQILEDQLCLLTPENDKNRKDDHADAMIWAMTELRGITQGSYLEAYGFHYCNACGHAYAKIHRKCPACGHETGEEQKKPFRPNSLAAAYLNQCRKCGETYPLREKQCPKCSPNPQGFIAAAQAMMTQGQRNWIPFQPRDIMRGR
ncbi:MAG TPA: terminase family protein [Puia sp.]|nr:terminase family protein [Puia sp.]